MVARAGATLKWWTSSDALTQRCNNIRLLRTGRERCLLGRTAERGHERRLHCGRNRRDRDARSEALIPALALALFFHREFHRHRGGQLSVSYGAEREDRPGRYGANRHLHGELSHF